MHVANACERSTDHLELKNILVAKIPALKLPKFIQLILEYLNGTLDTPVCLNF